MLLTVTKLKIPNSKLKSQIKDRISLIKVGSKNQKLLTVFHFHKIEQRNFTPTVRQSEKLTKKQRFKSCATLRRVDL